MIGNYAKIALRNLVRHRLYSAINLGGLAVGLACAILIMLFVQNELSYDGFHRNAGTIFRVLTDSKRPSGPPQIAAYTPMPLVPTLQSEFPEVLHAARFSTGGTIITAGDRSFAETVLYTDPDAFSMFDIEFVRGNPATALKDPAEIVITEPIAMKYFGMTDVIGRTLTIQSRRTDEPFTVAAVVKEMPPNSSLRFNFLANISKHSRYPTVHDRWTSSNGSSYIQMAPGASVRSLQGKMPAFVEKHYADMVKVSQAEGELSKEPDAFKVEFQPLQKIHLDSRVSVSPEEEGNPTYALILAVIGLFVLVIACINFTTLAIARSSNRGKEVGMRKVLGAFRMQLVRQFVGETLVSSFISLLIGIALAEIALPTFNQLAEKQLSFGASSGWLLPAALVVLLLAVACVAGIYPALYISRDTPVDILKGKSRSRGKNIATRSLVVLQFSLSIFLITGTVAISRQLGLLMTKDLGYNGSQVVVLTTHAGERAGAAEDLVNRLRSATRGNPNIVSISGTSGAFTQGYDINSFPYRGDKKETFVYRVDEEYLGTLEIPLKEGRNFTKGSAGDIMHGMIVNEAFLREFGWSESAVGRTLETDNNQFNGLEVIGVVRDFHFRSLREEVRPAMMFENPAWPLDNILVRIAPANISATVDHLRGVWKEIAPGKPFDFSFLDDDVQKQYQIEMKWGRIVAYASILAVSLACLGLFGLVTLSVGNRTKEIGIRKVLGASAGSVVGLVSRDFIRLVVVANVIAWPAAYIALGSWLENYASRIMLDVDLFLLAGGAALGIALLTISVQVIRAALSNPVESLRYE
jgi:putative ABC transport system permease protein